MFTRKLTHLMALAAAGLIGVGVVLADDTRPAPVPAATQAAPPAAIVPPVVAPPPAIPLPSPIDAYTTNSRSRPGQMADERMIVIQALCIQAPAGFCERTGLAEEQEKTSAWMLSRREARMLNALIRAEKEKGGLEIHSRPQITCSDNQTAFVQVGQEVPVPVKTRVETKEKNGSPIPQTTMETRAVGSIIRVTPRGLPDGTFLLDAQLQHTTSGPALVDLGNGTTAPAFNSQKVSATALVTDGGAALFRCGMIQSADGKKHELLWVLTPQLMKSPPDVRPPAKQPAPALPPDAVPPAPAEPVTTIQPAPPPVPVVLPDLRPTLAPRRP